MTGLIYKLQNQGYKLPDFKRLAIRFFNKRSSLIEKYGERNIDYFIAKIRDAEAVRLLALPLPP
jgi:hypothetical protein